MKPRLITLWFIFLTQNAKSQENIKQKSDVDYVRSKFFDFEEELWRDINSLRNNSDKNVRRELFVLEKFEIIDNQLEQTIKNINNIELVTLEDLHSYVNLHTELQTINVLYDIYRRFQKSQLANNPLLAPKETWSDLANAILFDSKNNITKSIVKIDFIINNKLFSIVREHISENACKETESPQSALFYLYNLISIVHLKGYIMIQFSYMLKFLYDEVDSRKATLMYRNFFKQYADNLVNEAKDAMKSASNELWRCDPKQHKLGETYEELTQLIQGYIENEVDLNEKGTCWQNCVAYSHTKSYDCYKKLFCGKQRQCRGKIRNCRFIASDADVCLADIKKQKKRRYEYVRYDNNKILGKQQKCSRNEEHVYSWWRWLFWHCSYCFCLCEEQSPQSDRFINLKPAIANVQNNMVVTGLRFIKHNRIIHLQIQEGKLLPRGHIDPDTVHWTPVMNYSITDKNIYNGQDYHTLTWEKRAIDLDNVEADSGYVVTGVKFKTAGSHLTLNVLTTEFDFKAGTLVQPENSVYKEQISSYRTEVQLKNPDVPTLCSSPSIPDSRDNQFVQFTYSDIDKDAAQTTVPFFDTQPVESKNAKPLSGVGIYHKGRSSCGGFVAPKIMTYDFSQHL